ncbi:MAG: 23S rRNA (adenine(2503)-C(2))-methyltransferase RlmN, partial [Alphaproteobacteria bacterium]|nr:23S rRNA (adenine(2503)-C(2))-methyltransferase RlmN [Alphaproteobacteria bacterium]
NELRSQIMPINNKYPLEQVLAACREYQGNDGSRYITFEYLLLNGVNDTVDCARELIALMKKYQLRATFNLIPFNPWPGCTFQPSSNNRVHAFAKELENAGFAAPIRVARGQDILAACGQLKSQKDEEGKKSK